MDYKYRKVIVLGNNGSGKSYFSKKLADKTKLPLIHLDLLYWLENWEFEAATVMESEKIHTGK